MLSSKCFYSDPDFFYNFYKKYMIVDNVKPNITHYFLTKLETRGKLKAIITQNIDGLHTKAGSKNVYEIHGSIYKNHCLKCNMEYDLAYIVHSEGIPKCKCGGIIKPDVVLYGEGLPNDTYNKAMKAIRCFDMLIVLGSSLTVFPAYDLINYFQGKYLVIINRDKTDFDDRANLVIHKNLKDIFTNI